PPARAGAAGESFAFEAGKGPRGSASDGARGQLSGTEPPTDQLRTARCEQSEKSDPKTLCPTPGTTRTCPRGNSFATAVAAAVGVRLSKPPERASIGTSGGGPGA